MSVGIPDAGGRFGDFVQARADRHIGSDRSGMHADHGRSLLFQHLAWQIAGRVEEWVFAVGGLGKGRALVDGRQSEHGSDSA